VCARCAATVASSEALVMECRLHCQSTELLFVLTHIWSHRGRAAPSPPFPMHSLFVDGILSCLCGFPWAALELHPHDECMARCLQACCVVSRTLGHVFRYVHGPSGDGCKYVPPSGMGEQVLSVRASAPRARIGTASRDAASKRKCHDVMEVSPHRASRRPFKLTSCSLQS
jgi:hypothetical protein